jgi:hypothetical protein
MRPSCANLEQGFWGKTICAREEQKSALDYQLAAIEAVCDLFRGQEICRTEFTVVSGAASKQMLMGFAEQDLGLATVTPKPGYVDNMVDWNDPLYRAIIKRLPKGTKLGQYVASVNIEARKPVRIQ